MEKSKGSKKTYEQRWIDDVTEKLSLGMHDPHRTAFNMESFYALATKFKDTPYEDTIKENIGNILYTTRDYSLQSAGSVARLVLKVSENNLVIAASLSTICTTIAIATPDPEYVTTVASRLENDFNKGIRGGLLINEAQVFKNLLTSRKKNTLSSIKDLKITSIRT